jgi:hypothetical protein
MDGDECASATGTMKNRQLREIKQETVHARDLEKDPNERLGAGPEAIRQSIRLLR